MSIIPFLLYSQAIRMPGSGYRYKHRLSSCCRHRQRKQDRFQPGSLPMSLLCLFSSFLRFRFLIHLLSGRRFSSRQSKKPFYQTSRVFILKGDTCFSGIPFTISHKKLLYKLSTFLNLFLCGCISA